MSMYPKSFTLCFLLSADYVHDSQSATDSRLYTHSKFLSFCYAPKDQAPFSYIYPTKSPLLMIKYELSTSCRWCFRSWVHEQTDCWVVQKIAPPQEPWYAPQRKIPFINAVKPFYGCQRSALKILRLLCRSWSGLVLRLGLSVLLANVNVSSRSYMLSPFRLSFVCRLSVCLWRWCSLLSRLKFSTIFLRRLVR